MIYFFDTEFIECFKKPIKWLPTIGNFNKPYHSIQLISIGIVAEDGREYYAISNEFNPDDASKWVWNNVLKKIWEELHQKERYARDYHYDLVEPFNKKSLKTLIGWNGKSNEDIAYDIFRFVHQHVITKWDDHFAFSEEIVKSAYEQGEEVHQFYAYYADYDWVLFCSLWGTMMDLPNGFPMYCRDLKQMLDEKIERSTFVDGDYEFKRQDLEWKLAITKKRIDYPEQENEHNALDDAKWNKKLYEFIKSL